MKLQDQYAEKLIGMGAVEIKTRTNKYRVFKGHLYYFFLGKSGAVRVNTEPKIDGSWPTKKLA